MLTLSHYVPTNRERLYTIDLFKIVQENITLFIKSHLFLLLYLWSRRNSICQFVCTVWSINLKEFNPFKYTYRWDISCIMIFLLLKRLYFYKIRQFSCRIFGTHFMGFFVKNFWKLSFPKSKKKKIIKFLLLIPLWTIYMYCIYGKIPSAGRDRETFTFSTDMKKAI